MHIKAANAFLPVDARLAPFCQRDHSPLFFPFPFSPPPSILKYGIVGNLQRMAAATARWGLERHTGLIKLRYNIFYMSVTLKKKKKKKWNCRKFLETFHCLESVAGNCDVWERLSGHQASSCRDGICLLVPVLVTEVQFSAVAFWQMFRGGLCTLLCDKSSFPLGINVCPVLWLIWCLSAGDQSHCWQHEG